VIPSPRRQEVRQLGKPEEVRQAENARGDRGDHREDGRESSSWGYSRIVGALSNLGIERCEETIAEILRRHGAPPSPQRKPNVPWSEFIRAHQDVLAAVDFFTAEVMTAVGLVTYYVLFFMHLDTRRVLIAGITQEPARGVDEADSAQPDDGRPQLPRGPEIRDPRSRHKVHSIVSCHEERNHQGLDNVIPFPRRDHTQDHGEVECQERLGGLLEFYWKAA
jgi:hypothetical protein